MSRVGLVCSPSAWPDMTELRALGFHRGGVVRSLIMEQDPFFAWLDTLDDTVQLCALGQPSQTPGLNHDPDFWITWLSTFLPRVRGRVPFFEIANEQDLWGVPVEVVAALVEAIAPRLAGAGIRPILPGVASPQWQQYLAELVGQLSPNTRALCWGNVHPYGRRALGYPPGWGWGEIAEALVRAEELSGLAVVATESGIKYGDAGRDPDTTLDREDIEAHEQYTARWVPMVRGLDETRFPFLCYFAWADQVGAPDERGEQAFGLRDLDGLPRPSWETFSDLNGGEFVPPVPPPTSYEFVLGVKREAERLAVLGIDVGEPREHETYPYKDSPYSYQFTTTGKFVYSEAAKIVHFFKAEGK